jgi:hypothetical protein
VTTDTNERLRAMLADLPMAHLAEQGTYAQEMVAFWTERQKLLDGEAQRRLEDNGSDLMTGDTWAIERQWGSKSYDWDIDMLLDNVAPNMPAEMWAEVYSETLPPPLPPPQPVRRVNTAKLQALARRLGLDLAPFATVRKGAPKYRYSVTFWSGGND